jgi:hypothetical protein
MRMCVFCRRREPRQSLERHSGRFGVADGQAGGRGWYVCHDSACLRKLAAWRARTLPCGDRSAGTADGDAAPGRERRKPHCRAAEGMAFADADAHDSASSGELRYDG